MQVQQITTTSDEIIKLGKFNVLVGPNNVGKSRTLKDILRKISVGEKSTSVVIKKVEYDFPSTFDELIAGLKPINHPNNVDQTLFRDIGPNLVSGAEQTVNLDQIKSNFDNEQWRDENQDWFTKQFGKFRIAHLDAESRLNIASQSPAHDSDTGAPQKLIQAIYPDFKAQKSLNEAFLDIFQQEVRLDYSKLSPIRFKVAHKFEKIPEHPVHAKPVMEKYERLDDQGDGFRSLAGVLLALLLCKGRIILIDEPEAFLHPYQAKKLGYWVGKLSSESKSQIIVATHNPNFLSGVLASSASVNVFRLNRNGNDTKFRKIEAAQLKKLATSPLLSNQRVLDAVFQRGTIVCEADSDRLYYETIANKLEKKHQVQFLHAHNKQTIYKVTGLLRSADIPTAAIPDFDIINSETDIVRIYESFGQSCPEKVKEARRNIAKEVEGADDKQIIKNILKDIKTLRNQLKKGEHSLSGARSALRRIADNNSQWKTLKRKGIEGLPEAVVKDGNDLVEELNNIGVFPIPVGELESWKDYGVKKKSKWIVAALQDLANSEPPQPASKFIESVIEHVEKC